VCHRLDTFYSTDVLNRGVAVHGGNWLKSHSRHAPATTLTSKQHGAERPFPKKREVLNTERG
jgi:hypothetical protein